MTLNAIQSTNYDLQPSNMYPRRRGVKMYYYIINPAAGGGKINKIQTRLKALLKEKRIDGDFAKSIGKGDASKITKIAIRQGFKTIIAVGGDSTVLEVVNGIIDNSDIALGILPIGSTNVIARLFGINDWVEATDILAQRKLEKINLGQVNNSFFINSVQLGIENELSQERKDISPLNNLLFKGKVMRKILQFKSFFARLDFEEGFSVSSDIFNISVINGGKDYNSDKLQVILVPNQSKFNLLKKLSKVTASLYVDLSFVSKFQTKKVSITTKKPKQIFADNEYIGMTPMDISTTSKKIKIIVNKQNISRY